MDLLIFILDGRPAPFSRVGVEVVLLGDAGQQEYEDTRA